MPKIPGVNDLDAVRAFEKAGFPIVRQGKHIVMSNGQRILTIPRQAAKHALVRVIDESGEDYLYPKSFFAPIELPQPIRRAVLAAV